MHAVTGIIDVLLSIVALVIVSAPPAVGSSARDVAAYYAANGDAVLVSGYIAMLAIIFFLWFASYLYGVLTDTDGAASPTATLFFGAALVAGTMFLAFSAMGQTLPFRAADGVDLAAGHALSDVVSVGLSASAIPALVMVGAASAVILRTGAMARWVGIFGILIAALLAVASATVLARSGTLAAGGTVFVVGYGAFLLWELALSIVLLARREPNPAVAAAA